MGKRRLEDLFVTGKEVIVDDGEGEPVTVWIQKLNPVDGSTALRKANSARARYRIARRKPETDEYMEAELEVLDLGDDRDALIDYILLDKIARAEMTAEGQVEGRDEWKKDDYLTTLRDAWAEGLEERFILDDTDEEAKRVFDELKRFGDEAKELAEVEIATLREEYEAMEIEELQKVAIKQRLDFSANVAWLEEHRKCEIWLGTFEPDRKTRYFTDRQQLDFLSAQAQAQLLNAYESLNVDVMEGKGSRETTGSSPSSEPSPAEETEASSGPVAVSQ